MTKVTHCGILFKKKDYMCLRLKTIWFQPWVVLMSRSCYDYIHTCLLCAACIHGVESNVLFEIVVFGLSHYCTVCTVSISRIPVSDEVVQYDKPSLRPPCSQLPTYPGRFLVPLFYYFGRGGLHSPKLGIFNKECQSLPGLKHIIIQ